MLSYTIPKAQWQKRSLTSAAHEVVRNLRHNAGMSAFIGTEPLPERHPWLVLAAANGGFKAIAICADGGISDPVKCLHWFKERQVSFIARGLCPYTNTNARIAATALRS